MKKNLEFRHSKKTAPFLKKMAVFFEKMAAFSKNVEAFYLKRLSVWFEKSQRFYRMNFMQELHRNGLNISPYESNEAVKQL